MVNQVTLAVRTAFIANRIAEHLTGDSTPAELAVLCQSDPLKAMIQAYFLCMGLGSNDKANLFSFRRLLAESGLRYSVPDDMLHAIQAECQAGISGEVSEIELASFATKCIDPYRSTSDSIVRLGLNLDQGNERLLCLEQERERQALEQANQIKLARERLILEKVKAVVRPHSTTLARKKRQLVIRDDYGIPDRKRWNEEVRYILSPASEMADHVESSGSLMVSERTW